MLKLDVNFLTFHTPVKHTKMNFNLYNYNSFDVVSPKSSLSRQSL